VASLARFRSSGCGSASAPPALDDDSAEDDSVEDSDELDSDEVFDDSAGADELDSDELGDDDPVSFGFWVVAPQAATIPATASAAITVVTREIRDIDLPFTSHHVVRGPIAVLIRAAPPWPYRWQV
jgi:hypothetical protein